MHTNHPRRLRRILIAVALTAASLGATAVTTSTASAAPVSQDANMLVVPSKSTFVVGELAKFTVTFPGRSPKPTGTFELRLLHINQTAATVPIVNGKAILSTRLLTRGANIVQYFYSGDGNYDYGSELAIINVFKGSTATTGAVRTQPVPSGTGAVISSATKRVSPATGGTLAGTTTFTALPAAAGNPVTATVPAGATGGSSWKPKLADGTWTVIADYSGNADYNGNTSAPFTVQVGAPPAVSVIDQIQPQAANAASVGTFGDVAYVAAQTFTPALTGKMDKVGVQFDIFQGDPSTISVQIQGTTDGLPNGAVIGSGSYTGAGSGFGTWVDIPLTVPADVVAGQQYAIVLAQVGGTTLYSVAYSTSRGNIPGAQLYGSTDDGASYFEYGPFDLAFRTWVLAA